MKKIKSSSNRINSLSHFSRRDILKALPALALSSRLLAQQSAAPVPVLKLHNFGLRVSDVGRSLEFYQGLFGSPIQARQGRTVVLRMGDGPYFYSLSPLATGEQPGITHIGLSVANFDLERARALLEGHGIVRGAPPMPGQGALSQAMRSWVKRRGPAEGGSAEGTQELFFADRDGLFYQLNDQAHCGGSGPLGNTCDNLESSPDTGLIRLLELSHFTNFVHNRDYSNQFQRTLFGKDFQAYQGPNAPVIGVGDGVQFLMYTGGSNDGQPQQPGQLNHVCMGMVDFDVERVRALLDDYGLSPRQQPSNTPPLVHYVSMRMPNRGGAEGGTPELYFSDPDGIRIQLQDPSYCGGGGYLGDDCSA